jgi:hypothetical protein
LLVVAVVVLNTVVLVVQVDIVHPCRVNPLVVALQLKAL